ncbi:glycosyltransferase involved in cell wall biosynthesis [Azospirillum fermentarium]|uniref:glycosyltransferase family 4 protein n=1 Tax=Azospirillum fermentarium TaxID=1233114 RepID=UPI0022267CE1|nr:glycosyltransferase family 4 protein [Azospirillum fermentarium]MCW2249601.1 glycosyltransferase involved in cell wall biosynthesis [Azospirillum fermentarium]
MPRRIVVHDYAGYAFPLQLSRWLAGQGHTVLHVHCDDVESPRGPLAQQTDGPPGLTVEGLSLGRPLPKYQLVRRWMQDMAYGSCLGRRTAAFRPDVILSANCPPAAQARLAATARRAGIPLVCWVQDVFAVGAAMAVRRWPALIRWAALRHLQVTEYQTLRRCAGLILITDDFVPLLKGEGVSHPHTTVIENWAPADAITVRPKENPWAKAHGLTDVFVFLYAGTLGMKHNPGLLADLARAYRDDPSTRVVVVSQGPGRAQLEEVKAAEGLNNLLLFDYQPFECVSDVLATGDALLTLLEDFAGVISAPSKIYSYFCAERPILAAAPASNLARRVIEREEAGVCVDASDRSGFIAAARRLRNDLDLRARLAAGQRRYARSAFDIDRIGPRFCAALETAIGGKSGS